MAKKYSQAEVETIVDQALGMLAAQNAETPSPVEYDVAILRQYALYQAMNFNVQLASVKGAPTMEQVIVDAAKILEYLGHGTELTPSLAAYQSVLMATADKSKQYASSPNGYV